VRFDLLLLTGAAALLVPPLHGQAPSGGTEIVHEAGEAAKVLDYEHDLVDRMTVPVSISGQGPFRFVVDTGAERTVISREVARELDLDPGATARVHSITEVSDIATVVIPRLVVGGRQVDGIEAPALEQRHLGAQGMLGVDSLQSQRVSFDFARRQMTVTPSKKREERWPSDTIVVKARSRFGHLILVDAAVDGQKVWVILDTGSEATIGNMALRRRLEQRSRIRDPRPVELVSITGGRSPAERATVKRIRVGGIDIFDFPVAFADAHPFRQLDLMDRPALLLGMDALRLFERVSVDFANRKVRLLPTGRSGAPVQVRMAASAAPRPRS
jgi:predicted aspartyl protease